MTANLEENLAAATDGAACVPRCVIHADRAGVNEALGHRLCDECFETYRVERREQQAFSNRVFLQRVLRAGYALQS